MQSINYILYYGIQLDWQHPMSTLALTTLERSSHSLMLDQELALIHHVPGIATPITLVVYCGCSPMGVHCPYTKVDGGQFRTKCSSDMFLILALLCFVVPHTSVLMENTAVWGGLMVWTVIGNVSPSVSADYNYCLLCPILTPTPTAPCPTLSPLSNGMISYDNDTNMATYTCNTGYTISGATPITCMSDDTSSGTWSPSPPTVTCAREYCIYRLLIIAPCTIIEVPITTKYFTLIER